VQRKKNLIYRESALLDPTGAHPARRHDQQSTTNTLRPQNRGVFHLTTLPRRTDSATIPLPVTLIGNSFYLFTLDLFVGLADQRLAVEKNFPQIMDGNNLDQISLKASTLLNEATALHAQGQDAPIDAQRPLKKREAQPSTT
jgi:hypothetical protein